MRFHVVPATPLHLPEILRIERDSYPRPWSAEGFLHEMERNPVALALAAVAPGGDHGRVGGYLFAWDLGEEIRINNIAVDGALRRRGVARMLLRHVTTAGRAGACRRVTLEVRAGNRPARALYRAAGFVEVGRRPRHYEPDGEDALLLERRLDR